MRSKNALSNLITYIVYEIFAFALGILIPHFIILIYGSEVNGLTSTITRILSLINLVQAGAVGAAIYQMYKPVADNDFETQSAIIYSSRKFYNKISLIYFALAVAIGLFYSFYLENDNLKFLSIFLSFLILALNGTNILLFNSICDIFLSPHQKKYYLSISAIVELVVRYGLMAVVLALRLNFVFIYVCYLIGGISSIFLNIFFYKKFSKKVLTRNPKCKDYKIPDRKYLMLASIGSEIVSASPTIIITTFISLTSSSIFSLYALIFTSMKTILNSIQLSFSAIFGNLTKSANDSKIYQVYSIIELITIALGTICASCVGFLLPAFVNLYTIGADANYLSTSLAIFTVVFTVIFAFRTSFSFVATVYGLFKDTCKITLVFGGIGILVSLFCVIAFGMPYVMIGIIFNELSCAITTLVVIKKKVLWFKTKKLLVRSCIMAIVSALSTVAYYIGNPIITNWATWILYGVIIGLISLLIISLYCFAFERKSISLLFGYFKTFRKKENL